MMMAWTGLLAVEGISNGLGRGVRLRQSRPDVLLKCGGEGKVK